MLLFACFFTLIKNISKISRKNNKKNNKEKQPNQNFLGLHPETKQTIWAIICIVLGLIFIFAGFKNAGPAGNLIYNIFEKFFGLGYFLLPLILLILV